MKRNNDMKDRNRKASPNRRNPPHHTGSIAMHEKNVAMLEDGRKVHLGVVVEQFRNSPVHDVGCWC